MGYASGWKSKVDIVSTLLAPTKGPLQVIDHALVGNHLWTVRQFKEATDSFPAGFRFVQLYLLASHGGTWGYKGICESAHPYYYDCPERLLAASDDTGSSARNWRDQCRVERGNRSARTSFLKGLASGDAVIVDGTQAATFSRTLPGETRSVAIQLNGREYRVAKSRLSAPLSAAAA